MLLEILDRSLHIVCVYLELLCIKHIPHTDLLTALLRKNILRAAVERTFTDDLTLV